MEDIYMDTHLHFCEAGEDIELYEKACSGPFLSGYIKTK